MYRISVIAALTCAGVFAGLWLVTMVVVLTMRRGRALVAVNSSGTSWRARWIRYLRSRSRPAVSERPIVRRPSYADLERGLPTSEPFCTVSLATTPRSMREEAQPFQVSFLLV